MLWQPRHSVVGDRPVVVITGANGFIGQRLVAGFDAGGWAVRALVHRIPAWPSPGATYVEWRLTETATPSLVGAALLVHAASVRYDDANAGRLNLEGSDRLVTEARAAAVGRLTFVSSMSARDGAPSQYGKDKFEISGLFDGPSDLVVRPGLVLGDGGLFGRLRGFVTRRRIVPLVGGGHQRFQTVHVDDLVAAMVAAATNELSGTLTIAEREPVEFRVLLAELARLLDSHPRFVPVPYGPVAAAMRVARQIGVRLPVSADNLAGLRGLETAHVDADLDRIGVAIRDYRASLRALVEGG